MPKRAPVVADTLADFLPDWEQYLRAAGKSARTVSIYLGAARELVDFLGADVAASAVTHRHVQRYLIHLADRPNKKKPEQKVSPSYVNQQYRSIQQLFRWLVDIENELAVSPVQKVPAPQPEQKIVNIIPDQDLKKILGTCDATTFIGRRDAAIIRLFIDTGCRRAEIVNLTLDDLDLGQRVIFVVGKGARPRVVPFGDKTAEALRRYLRARAKHTLAGTTDRLWIGSQGALGANGVRMIVTRRARSAGVSHTFCHMFRHTFAHRWLSEGNGEDDLMRLAGWKSRQMVGRYGASAADERARNAHKRAGLGDRI